MTTFNAYFLAAYFVFVALFYLVRLQMQPTPRQRIGERGSSHWFGHFAFRFFRVLIVCVCVLRLVFPQTDNMLFLFDSLSYWPVLLSGTFLLVAGFALTVVGHYTLGMNWLSGIHPNKKTQLVTHGVYACSRNPMYIGVLATQLGFFLALPSGFTLLCLLIGFAAIFNQVRLEEKHLSSALTPEYEAYKARVPRWV